MAHDGILAGLRLLVMCAAFWLAASAVGVGEIGVSQTFPGARTRMRNGLTVTVDTRGVVANGYRNVRVTIANTPTRNRPPVPVTADRRLRVVLEPSGVGHLTSVTTSQVIEIPEKQASAEATVAIPCAGEWFQLQVTVYEGGDKLEDVSGRIPMAWFGMRTDVETLPTLLMIDYDAPDRAARDQKLSLLSAQGSNLTATYTLPDIRPLVAVIPYTNVGMAAFTPAVAQTSGKPLSDAEILSLVGQHAKVQLLSPVEMPKRWIELSCYDVAFISFDDLAKMAKKNAAQRQALVDWLHGGTSLVVYGAGKDYSRLAEVEKLLSLPALPGAKEKTSSYRGWVEADRSDRFKARIMMDQQQVSYGPMGQVVATNSAVPATVPVPPIANQSPDPIQPPFVGRRAGLGWVAAIAHPDPFSDVTHEWNWVLNSIDPKHQEWLTRHGISYQSYNRGLWNWYIPGVGAAPIFSFLLLATLFAIVIGPVNYLILGRAQRLYLLLVTVPAGAAVVTLGLFAYAVLSDGLGVKARIRSFALVDQKSGRTVSWSRQSYFASVVPSQGLKYPEDTVVWPIEEYPQANRSGPRHQLAWEPDGQRLRSGYLSSRRLTQLLVIRSAKSQSQLKVTQSAAGAPPLVKNGLGGTIERLILRDTQGNFYESPSPVKPDENSTLKPISKEDAQRRVSQSVADHRPDFPEGYDPAAEERRTTGSMFWYGSSTNPQLESSILERGMTGLQSSLDKELTPGAYFAVLDRNPEVPTGIASVTELKSFHVVVGRW